MSIALSLCVCCGPSWEQMHSNMAKSTEESRSYCPWLILSLHEWTGASPVKMNTCLFAMNLRVCDSSLTSRGVKACDVLGLQVVTRTTNRTYAARCNPGASPSTLHSEHWTGQCGDVNQGPTTNHTQNDATANRDWVVCGDQHGRNVDAIEPSNERIHEPQPWRRIR